MSDTRTLRERIDAALNDPEITAPVPVLNRIMATIAEYLPPSSTERPEGIDQGISRLAMLAFLAGEQSTAWNGKPGPHQWVRYRGHHVSRGDYPDGTRFSIQVRGHAGEVETRFEPTRNATGTEQALVLLDDIDQLLDIVIDAHGVPGDEIPEAEIVETIDGKTAVRVLSAYADWLSRRPLEVRVFGGVEEFADAVESGRIDL